MNDRPGYAERTEAALDHLLFLQAAPTLAASLGVATLAFLVLVPAVAVPRWLAAWYLFSLLTGFARFWLVSHFEKQAPDHSELRNWRGYYLVGLVFSTLGWVWLFQFFDPSAPAWTQAFLLMIAAGVTAGALPSTAPRLSAYAVVLVPICASVIVAFWRAGGIYPLAIPIVMLFGVMLLFSARNLNRDLRRSHRLRVENEDLAETLRSAKEQAEHAYADLRAQVDERARTEALLVESEQRFHDIARTIHSVIVIFREDFLYLNPAIERITGYRPEELIGKPFFSIVHPDDIEMVRERGRARLRGDPTPSEYELRVHTFDGQTRWLSASAARVEYAGQPAVLAALFDITQRKLAEDALRESEEKYRLLVDQVRDAIFIAQDGNLVFANQRTPELFGYEASEIVNRPFVDMVAPEFRELLTERHRKRLGGEQVPDTYTFQILNQTGRRVWVELSVVVVTWEERPATLNVLRNIDTERAVEEALFDARERAQITLQSIADGVISIDEHQRVEYLNPVAELLTGWSYVSARGCHADDVFHIRDSQQGRCLVDDLLRESNPTGRSLFLRRRDGEEFAVECSVAAIRDQSHRMSGAVMVFRNVTELRDLNQRLTHQASHDQLTGLANRREFEQRLDSIVQRARERDEQHALCYLDLDQFKVINDTVGHVAGDELLRQVADVLSRTVRASDTIARLGGDEFGLLIVDCSEEDARRIASELVAAVRGRRFIWEASSFELSVSVGLVLIHRETGDRVQLLRHSDVACYTAKDLGGGRVHVFEPDELEVGRRYGDILRAADINMALDEQRFTLYAQPIIPASDVDAHPLDFEVLLRLPDRESGMLLPESFLPAAQRFGLIASIDRWVIAESLRSFGEGLELFPGSGIAV
ncbi:MAG: PAS domain S-box protein, partial [Gammaproteobacteria bacterium]|nr:PAS domain S-box protein [Gammaproteobacteria bacterium]